MAQYWTLALILFILSTSSSSKTCPNSCICSTFDGLHKAVCGNIEELYKYTINQKHHNINILDLSHNNITKVKHQLDRLTELVSLDLSTNGLTELHKFLNNGKKIVHLKLSHNRIKKLSTSVLPRKISSLDLSYNLLENLPQEIGNLKHLEHLMLEGNPLDCSCENIKERDRLVRNGVVIDDVKCSRPLEYLNRSWKELKTKVICKNALDSVDNDYSEMMGDDPGAGFQNDVASSDLGHGEVFKDSDTNVENDDDSTYLKASHLSSDAIFDKIEGSGEPSSVRHAEDKKDDFLNDFVTSEPAIDNHEGSGDDGSGFGMSFSGLENKSDADSDDLFGTDDPELTTEKIALYTDSVGILIEDSIENEIKPESPRVFEGRANWDDPDKEPNTEPPNTASAEDTVSEKIQAKTPDELSRENRDEQKPTVHKTGTYVCIVIIIALLVGLIAFAVVKGQMRKRRDKRLLRQQQKDVEKADKEMVAMNQSLLGKPAPLEPTKKLNGNYELVPTHDSPIKRPENMELLKSLPDNKDTLSNSHQNLNNSSPLLDNTPTSDLRDETQSVSSEEIFVPSGKDHPNTSGLTSNTDSDLNSPIREYVPVYSPDMGRVRIKMTETPKPKTPVLVTRSRSNAGDLIITPAANGSAKSTT